MTQLSNCYLLTINLPSARYPLQLPLTKTEIRMLQYIDCNNIIMFVISSPICAALRFVTVIRSCEYFFCLGLYGYQGNRKMPFVKITMLLPNHINSAKKHLEQGFQCFGIFIQSPQFFESNVDFDTR